MGYQNYRVVAMTPYGRRETVSILLPYLRRDHDRGIVDEWYLFENTDNEQFDDRGYAALLVDDYRWIKLKHRPGSNAHDIALFPQMPTDWRGQRRTPKQLNTGRFYLWTQDRDTVYVRFDDDIVYVHPDAIQRMVRTALQPGVLAAFPIVIHNAVMSWHLQQRGLIPRDNGVVVAPYCMDPVGWADGNFARGLHQHFLSRLEERGDDGAEEFYLHTPIGLGGQFQFSVSCFAIRGDYYADLDGVLDWDEEENWLTMHRAGVLARDGVHVGNVIIPDGVVAHLSFFPHREYLFTTDVPARYRALARKLEATL